MTDNLPETGKHDMEVHMFTSEFIGTSKKKATIEPILKGRT